MSAFWKFNNSTGRQIYPTIIKAGLEAVADELSTRAEYTVADDYDRVSTTASCSRFAG